LRLAYASRIVLPPRKGGAKAVNNKVSLDGPKRLGQRVSHDMDKGDQGLTPGKIHNVYDRDKGLGLTPGRLHKGKTFIAKYGRVI
jgi:hypothetical protein